MRYCNLNSAAFWLDLSKWVVNFLVWAVIVNVPAVGTHLQQVKTPDSK